MIFAGIFLHPLGMFCVESASVILWNDFNQNLIDPGLVMNSPCCGEGGNASSGLKEQSQC